MIKAYLRSLAAAAAVVMAAATSVAEEGATVLWSQNDHDTYVGVVSQNFEPEFDAYDCRAADDFVVPQGEIWVVKRVHVTGTYFASFGPARSESVVFYRNEGGLPGRVIRAYPELVGVDETGWGWFNIQLPEPLKLKPGRYWLSVQVNMDFNQSGQWGWESRATPQGKGAAWVNPGDGYGTGCTAYGREATCVQAGQGPEHMFALVGTRRPLR